MVAQFCFSLTNIEKKMSTNPNRSELPYVVDSIAVGNGLVINGAGVTALLQS